MHQLRITVQPPLNLSVFDVVDHNMPALPLTSNRKALDQFSDLKIKLVWLCQAIFLNLFFAVHHHCKSTLPLNP